jgi:DNA repair protein RadC
MAAMMKRMQSRVAKSIIAFHNHPSGEPEPSREDIHLSRRLQEAEKIMGIELLDHVITGERNYVSLKEKGFL